ncbi:MAG: Pyruvate, phosphate dikinase [Syntrophorhabdaceae bacterium PtaU1.Bin034]|nr:MAG: Pyruvate, phosphate dikinase [Syntrophorhabdaceae bacterium PtaU1.Bin034]
MDGQEKTFTSSALQVNLERTAATVEIPERYRSLMKVVEAHYGVLKRTRELLIELNHPYVNWEYVITQLKTLSIGDFYEFNGHPDGFSALNAILEVYLDIIKSSPSEEIREKGLRCLFDFLDTIIAKSNEFLPRNLPLFPSIIDSLAALPPESDGVLKKSSTYIKDILRFYFDQRLPVTKTFHALLYRVFKATYLFWLSQPDPAEWSNTDGLSEEMAVAYKQLIHPLEHRNLQALLERLEPPDDAVAEGNGDKAGSYIDMPDYFQIVNGYLLIADELERSEVFSGREHLVKLDFLFNVINTPALSDIHGTAFIEINRCLSMVFREEPPERLIDFLHKVFSLLKRGATRYTYRNTIIACVTTIGREVFKQNNHPLAEAFVTELIRFGFEHPDVKGSTAEWQIEVNPAHIENIRSWLRIIGMKPRWTKRLLSALIINLQIGGVFVRDTDLLQKDVSGLLNSDIEPAYNLVKQLLRIFPIYFNEIGAEGELREISTKVDELSFRNDPLVHFLRKQSHVESNSRLVTFMEDIFRYWYSSNKEPLQQHLPAEVYREIPARGEYFDGLHRIFKVILQKAGQRPEAFLEWDKQKIYREINAIKKAPERDRERGALALRLYQLLYKKYNPQHVDLLRDLEKTYLFDPAQIHSLDRSLRTKNHRRALEIILGFLSLLKQRILSPEKTAYSENIYRKRHIAAGIPSMYGTYREEKFEAVGLSLRLESLATVLFERLMESLNLKFITRSTISKIHDCLWLYIKALDLEGLATEGLVVRVKYITSALKIKQFSADQYLDIFRFISKGIQDIIRDHYIDMHRPGLPLIIGQILHGNGYDQGNGNNKALKPQDEETVYQLSENFIRSMISSAFGLQVADNFINSIIGTLSAELERFKDNKQILNMVMAYEPELTVTSLCKPDRMMDNQILIGNKGYFLKQLTFQGFRIPPGFIITTEVFRSYDAVIGYKYIFKDMTVRVSREIAKLEKLTGRKFGDPKNPLLLSVRSGATVSLPGMMHSFLNVGINEAIAEGLSRRDDFGWAAWDSYRRFLQVWGMFHGLDRNFFDSIIDKYKVSYGITRKIQFNPGQMRQVALAYKKAMKDRGIEVAENPNDQLRETILRVFASWDSEQARIYRRQMRLSDEWGTAVIVQAMVFGNLDAQSGSGVVFTRNPKGQSAEVTLYGDFIFGVQGDDIVSGLVETYPISEKQRMIEKRRSHISLESRFPVIYGDLVRLSEMLIYEKRFNHQEIEFTFERPTADGLYILQTRDMVQMETRKLETFEDTEQLRESMIGTGIGVSGGALCGRSVYSEDDIRRFRATEPDTPLILIRPDTVPDDVGILLQVDGLLTARGGSTSHAAVTIPQLNKVGVVGFSQLKVYESEGHSTVEGCAIRSGDFIGIDGWSGAVYFGKHEIER